MSNVYRLHDIFFHANRKNLQAHLLTGWPRRKKWKANLEMPVRLQINTFCWHVQHRTRTKGLVSRSEVTNSALFFSKKYGCLPKKIIKEMWCVWTVELELWQLHLFLNVIYVANDIEQESTLFLRLLTQRGSLHLARMMEKDGIPLIF